MTQPVESTAGNARNLGLSSRVKKILLARETGVFIALVLMCLFLWQATDAFLTTRNLLNVGRQISLLGIMAIGMTFVLISREVDLSVGSIYALAGFAVVWLILLWMYRKKTFIKI